MSSPEQAADAGPGVVRRFLLPGLFVLALFVALYMRRPDPADYQPKVNLSGPTMGTTWNVTAITPHNSESRRAQIKAAIASALERVNASMSTYMPDSELSRFNREQTTQVRTVSDGLSYVVGRAEEISVRTDGAFDVTVGPLVNAWGFGPDGPQTQPTDSDLSALSAQVGYKKLLLDAEKRTLTKQVPGLYVDLSAIAKGYGVDEVAKVLDGLQIDRYLVEIGGEVRARGHNDRDIPWRVGIEKPVSSVRAIQEVVAIDNRAMATSGDYRNYREENGVRISHSIDPRTGRPITHRGASVTVIAERCVDADGWATALNVLGPTEGLALAKRENIAALFLIRGAEGQFEEKATPAFERIREQSDPRR